MTLPRLMDSISCQFYSSSTFRLDTINLSCVLRLYCPLPLQTQINKITDRHSRLKEAKAIY